MTLYEELKARGLVAQITDEEIIDLINNCLLYTSDAADE